MKELKEEKSQPKVSASANIKEVGKGLIKTVSQWILRNIKEVQVIHSVQVITERSAIYVGNGTNIFKQTLRLIMLGTAQFIAGSLMGWLWTYLAQLEGFLVLPLM